MPTYSYRCENCNHEYEAFQAISALPHSVCPQCEGTVRRLIGAGAGILFKGSGFYTTDYRDSKAGAPAPDTASQTAAGQSTAGQSGSGQGNGQSKGSSAGSGSGENGNASGSRGAPTASTSSAKKAERR